LQGVDYCSTPNAAQNIIYLWVSSDDVTYTPDNQTYSFYGVTGTSGPCGGASGSGSVSGGGPFVVGTIRVAGFSVPLPRVLIATITAGTGSFGCLVGVMVPLTYHATLHGSSSGGWFGCACLAAVGLPGYYLEVSTAGSPAAMTVGAKIVRAPGVPALHSHGTAAPCTTGPFLLTCFRTPLAGDGVSPGTGGVTLAITE
jgi:hypothetical protein